MIRITKFALAVMLPSLMFFGFAFGVERVTYECKGNLPTYVNGDRIKDMDMGGDFEYTMKSPTGAYDLRLGRDFEDPLFWVIPKGNDRVFVRMATESGLRFTSENGLSYTGGETQLSLMGLSKITVSQESDSLRISAGEAKLRVFGGQKMSYQEPRRADGMVEFEVKTGQIEFSTSNDRSVECEIDIK